MSYTCGEIIRHIDGFAPPRLALEGDPIGLHLGETGQPARRLFLALELTAAVLEEILDFQADMVFVHHTPFFRPQKQLRDDWDHDRLILALIRRQTALYTAHTNLDCVRGGVNDVLAALIGIENSEILEPVNQNIREAGLGRIGALRAPLTLAAFAGEVGAKLGHPCPRYCGDGEKIVRQAACCGGSGAFLIGEAKARGADVYVTADVRHHEATQALELGLGVIDAGHFATENPVIPVLARYLAEHLPELEIKVSAINAEPFIYQKRGGEK
ncbi:MAG: Nif3-like dinuclear metal center hexameric protein [Peptococcaceae bacterium]|jgi:dinuclear metal center YbgI/SA1388 family protein|nr:Nif3-like dinuclear metal center hexameric protein [Peptococcaceae bacterium]